MEYEHILALIDRVAQTGLSSFKYEADGVKISIKGKEALVCAPSGDAVQIRPEGTDMSAAFLPAEPVSPVPGGNIVNSPLVGTFYTAPAEDAEPFVKVGDNVKKGQVLAIVEAMKLMNEIESDYDGVVKDILVKNGEPVEYGQPLFVIGD